MDLVWQWFIRTRTELNNRSWEPCQLHVMGHSRYNWHRMIQCRGLSRVYERGPFPYSHQTLLGEPMYSKPIQHSSHWLRHRGVHAWRSGEGAWGSGNNWRSPYFKVSCGEPSVPSEAQAAMQFTPLTVCCWWDWWTGQDIHRIHIHHTYPHRHLPIWDWKGQDRRVTGLCLLPTICSGPQSLTAVQFPTRP